MKRLTAIDALRPTEAQKALKLRLSSASTLATIVEKGIYRNSPFKNVLKNIIALIYNKNIILTFDVY